MKDKSSDTRNNCFMKKKLKRKQTLRPITLTTSRINLVQLDFV